ncbi:D-alanyl-D-alanine carboxypeptidase [Microbacterium sp.]|uniref:D-alanyl-D-alanine carboxypeptidase n=1 Tax=Microbacterium sp. TaxID=51671 RepID=UPI0039E4CABE
MTSPDAPPPSRRALRRQAQETEPESRSGRIALAWIDPDVVATRVAPRDLTAASAPFVPVLPVLIRRRRSRAPLLVTAAILMALAGGYTVATQTWSLDAVAPTIAAADAPRVEAPTSALSWPDEGDAAVGVAGIDAVAASSTDAAPMASITKLVSALMVLDEAPLAEGEAGPARTITAADRATYWAYVSRGESALPVPVGGTLTQYQQLQGALIASAGNYIAMLTEELWPTEAEFAAAAREWLDGHDLSGIRIVEPTGIDRENTADAASLIRLAEIAADQPVIAEIVATETAEIPGVGEIENTNPLLGDDGVIGLKTGGLVGNYNLLADAEVEAAGQTVRVSVAVLGQPTEELRASETADLLQQAVAEVQTPHALPAGTVVGTASTAWGTRAEVATTTEASVLLWNGASATGKSTLDLGDARDADQIVGTLTLTGPLDSASVEVALTDDLGEPDGWWRFTHPLELFGLAR